MPSGARSSALLAAASAASIVVLYIFLLAAGRILGSEDYGSLAALLGLLTVVVLPAGALQMAVSREISRRLAHGDEIGADAFATAAVRLALLATVPLVGIALALAFPLARLLNIESVDVVVLAEITLAAALPFSRRDGRAQGQATVLRAGRAVRLPVFIAARLPRRRGGRRLPPRWRNTRHRRRRNRANGPRSCVHSGGASPRSRRT